MARRAIEAANRRDYDVAFAAFHQHFEAHPPLAPLAAAVLGGFPATIHSRDERIRLEGKWREDWGEFRYEPDQLIDVGDRLLLLGRMVGSGPNSGADVQSEWADLFTIENGQVVREQVFFSRAEALAAAGLGD
jgi:SnoaL-like protein